MLTETRPLDTERLSTDPISQRIAIAQGWVDWLSSEAKVLQASLETWKRYLDLLEGVRCAEEELEVAAVNGRVSLSIEAAQRYSLTELLVHFTYHQPMQRTTNKAALVWAVGQGFYADRKRAKVAVNSIFGHRRDLFRRINRGTYALTAKATEKGKPLSLEIRSQFPCGPADGRGLFPTLAGPDSLRGYRPAEPLAGEPRTPHSNGRHISHNGPGSP